MQGLLVQDKAQMSATTAPLTTHLLTLGSTEMSPKCEAGTLGLGGAATHLPELQLWSRQADSVNQAHISSYFPLTKIPTCNHWRGHTVTLLSPIRSEPSCLQSASSFKSSAGNFSFLYHSIFFISFLRFIYLLERQLQRETEIPLQGVIIMPYNFFFKFLCF